jgi:hypothetical protein
MFEALDELEQPIDLLIVKRAGRLVHDEDARLEDQSLGDLDHLSDGKRKFPDGAGDVDLQPELFQQLPGSPLLRSVIHPETAAHVFPAQEDIVFDAHRVYQGEVLVDGGYPVAGCVYG